MTMLSKNVTVSILHHWVQKEPWNSKYCSLVNSPIVKFLNSVSENVNVLISTRVHVMGKPLPFFLFKCVSADIKNNIIFEDGPNNF